MNVSADDDVFSSVRLAKREFYRLYGNTSDNYAVWCYCVDVCGIDITYDDYLGYAKLLHALAMRRTRLKRFCADNDAYRYVYFVTLTLRDEYLNLKPSTYSKQLCLAFEGCAYVACREFGKRTQRLHYHALVFSDVPFDDIYYDDLDLEHNHPHSRRLTDMWSYGFVDVIDISAQGIEKTVNYVNKLSGYIQKDGLKSRLIYSRNREEKRLEKFKYKGVAGSIKATEDVYSLFETIRPSVN